MSDLSRFLLVPAGFLAVALAACATPPPDTDPEAVADYRATHDPLEPTNRNLYAVHDAVDRNLFVPVAETYRDQVPDSVRQPVSHFLDNLQSPVRFANDTFQAKPRRAGDTLMRFLINTTIGLAGLYDVAADLGYPRHTTDFGITLGLAGVGTGAYLFIPALGPSDLRDITTVGADTVLSPLGWVGLPPAVQAANYGRSAVAAVNTRTAVLGPVAEVKRTALDPYATFRSAYQQHRQAEIDATRNDDRATVPAWFATTPAALHASLK